MQEHYTKIQNQILEALAGARLNGVELAVALVMVRKIKGWGKGSDRISISQFMDATGYSRPAICRALKTLKIVNIALLVNNGLPGRMATEYGLNDKIEKWKIVNKALLVNKEKSNSKQRETRIVNKERPTKETITKETIQKKVAKSFSPESLELSGLLFSLIRDRNPHIKEDKIQTWVSDIDKMMRIDHYTYEQVRYLIIWSQQDTFWKSNILSGAKLRKQAVQLIEAARRGKEQSERYKINSYN